ncbi:MAG: response regulator [Kofleriaceae bacterium]
MAGDPYKYFRIEAHEIVGDLAKGLAELETSAESALISKLLRLAHTLKGAARIVRHKELAELSHELETVLGPLRDAPVPQRLDAGFQIVDRMGLHVAGLGAVAPVAAAPVAEVSAAAPPPPAPLQTSAIDDALGGIAAVHAVLARLRGITDPTALALGLEQIDRELGEVRRDVEHLRLSAAGSSYAALERTVRDAATLAGKRVRFAFEGSDVRADGQVIAALHGALVQLVRNAVVHGIELSPQRVAVGKPPDGHITIVARARGPSISLTCVDDGRGLDLAAIRTAAQRRGVALAGELDAAKAFELLLGGGISTAREVNELAGRGIGLELVRDAVHNLGGEVTVETSPRGTSITLVVPVSVTAIAAVRVAIGDRVVAIPQTAVRRVARVTPDQLIHNADGASICFDDVTVPVAPLGALFGTGGEHGRTVVFVESDGVIAAFTVDHTIGVDDVVVRALPPRTPIDPIVGGMALDAEGEPYPVVEPGALVAAVRRAQRVTPAATHRPLPILVVDDSLTTRMLEQSILESAGYEVDLAVSAEDALDKLERSTYALMLADVEMPGMDGFGLVREVRTRPAIKHLPAVLVTSRDAPADRARGAEVGAQGYIVKGHFDQSELLALIARLVHR